MSNPISTPPAFIVSLRNDPNQDGVPGDDFGAAPRYMLAVVPSGDSPTSYSYSLKQDVGAKAWATRLVSVAANGPVLIFIHGFDNLAPAVIARYLAVQSGLATAGGGVTVVCFDWPTSDKDQYRGDQQKAIKSGPRLVTDCIDVLTQAGIVARNIHVLTHSMGGYVLQNAFAQAQKEPRVGQMLMAEADVQELAFDITVNDPPTSALGCFLPWVHGLTVYWSSADAALKYATVFKDFVGPCGSAAPATPADATRLGEVGLSASTLASPTCSAKINNVGYADYYLNLYGPTASKKLRSDDSHVWPLLGTAKMPKANGDPHFMQDVWQVLTGAPKYTCRNPSITNNWTFSTSTPSEMAPK